MRFQRQQHPWIPAARRGPALQGLWKRTGAAWRCGRGTLHHWCPTHSSAPDPRIAAWRSRSRSSNTLFSPREADADRTSRNSLTTRRNNRAAAYILPRLVQNIAGIGSAARTNRARPSTLATDCLPGRESTTSTSLERQHPPSTAARCPLPCPFLRKMSLSSRPQWHRNPES